MSAKEHYWRMMDIADAFAKSTLLLLPMQQQPNFGRQQIAEQRRG